MPTRTNRSRRAVVLALVAAAGAIAVLAGVQSWRSAEASPSPTATTNGTVLRVGWTENPDSLNPFLGLTTSAYIIWHLNYDFLVGFAPSDLKPRPELATSWVVSPDGKTWTFKTRQGVKWQDGVPFTAADVAFTFNYIVHNHLPGVGPYTNGIVGAKATDANTVVIRTRTPKADMLDMIVPILPEHIWSKVPAKAAASSFQNKPPVIGTGPFQVVDYKTGVYVELRANKHYWGGAPHIDTLIFEDYTNPLSLTSDLRSGAIDAAVGVPTATFAALRGVPGLATNKGVSWTWSELGFNCSDSPASRGNPVLRDARFRQAIQRAIDRTKIVQVAYQGYATSGSTMIVPYTPYHWQPPAASLAADPAGAKALLDSAGYRDVNGDGHRETPQGGPLTLRLYASTDSPQDQTTARLVAGWLGAIGIRVRYTAMDAATLMSAIYNYKGATVAPDYDIAIGYWTNDVDPNGILQIFTPRNIGIWNDTYWANRRYASLYTLQFRTLAEQRRKPMVDQLQQIAYRQAPFVVLAYPYQLEAYDTDRWTGWVHTPSNAPGVSGSVLFSWNNIDTYRMVAPVTASASSGSSTALIAVIVTAVAVIVLAVALLLNRRRRRSVEE
jgi:peptide/nickel transport system substrate-binding protein